MLKPLPSEHHYPTLLTPVRHGGKNQKYAKSNKFHQAQIQQKMLLRTKSLKRSTGDRKLDTSGRRKLRIRWKNIKCKGKKSDQCVFFNYIRSVDIVIKCLFSVSPKHNISNYIRIFPLFLLTRDQDRLETCNHCVGWPHVQHTEQLERMHPNLVELAWPPIEPTWTRTHQPKEESFQQKKWTR